MPTWGRLTNRRRLISMDTLKIVFAILIVLAAAFLIAVVLLQSGARQGLGAVSGGAETFFGAKKATGMQAILQKLTGVVAVLFVVLTIAMNCIA